MGCNPSNLGTTSQMANMESRYKDARLPIPDVANYKNPFEREFYMLTNMMRDNPNSFVPQVAQYALSAHCSNPKATKKVQEKLKEVSQL